MDADGDGRIDLVVSRDGLAGYYPLRYDGRWDPASFRPYRPGPTFSLEDPEVALVDLDGDGVARDAHLAAARLGQTAGPGRGREVREELGGRQGQFTIPDQGNPRVAHRGGAQHKAVRHLYCSPLAGRRPRRARSPGCVHYTARS